MKNSRSWFMFLIGCIMTIYIQAAPIDNMFLGSLLQNSTGSLNENDKNLSCFPSLDFTGQVPTTLATNELLQNWWCDQQDEYAFLGFSYALDSCPSVDDITNDFKLMRSKYKARYVRLYGACDNEGYNDIIVNAASEANIGVYALVWFGFDNDDKWKTRMEALLSTIKNNPKAPYIIRNVAVGSEPLFDGVLPSQELAQQVLHVKEELADYGMQVSISEMPYGFQKNNDAPEIFEAIDIIETNVLPFFDQRATNAASSGYVVQDAIDYFDLHGSGLLLRMTQTGWPSTDEVWKPNSPEAAANVDNEKQYFELLDSKCEYFKQKSIGYMAHIWSDEDLPGWGIIGADGSPKFNFQPRTQC